MATNTPQKLSNSGDDKSRTGNALVLRQWILLSGLIVAVLVVLAIGVTGYALRMFNQPVPVEESFRFFEYSYAKMERGKYLFLASCADCHVDRSGSLGPRRLSKMPTYLGDIYVPNLSRDPLFGSSEWTDGELWRVLKLAVKRNGKRLPVPMPGFIQMSDNDIEALVSFLRLDMSIARPVPSPTTEANYSVAGKLISSLFRSQKHRATDASSDNRGKYLAEALLGCTACHSPGTGSLYQAKAYTGSDLLHSMSNASMASPSIRGKASTVGHYNLAQFSRLVRFGLTMDDKMVEMPLYPFLSDTDIELLYHYLRTLDDRNAVPQPMQQYRHREVVAEQCELCHAPVPPAEGNNFVVAHKLDPTQKPLYWQINAPTFPIYLHSTDALSPPTTARSTP